MLKSLFALIIIGTSLFGFDIKTRYPGYSYVFSEFDVDRNFAENPHFIDFVNKNEKRYKSFYRHSLQRGDFLLPLMQQKLMDDGLSDLLIYLAMVESGFSTDIVSPKKAVGLWQFMPATAKDYKLMVCDTVDERCDPSSATDAAAAYLDRLHKKFGKWYLAMMAYNCGEGRMQKAINAAGSDDLEVLLYHGRYLPKETRLYIQKILLVAMIGENISLDFGQMQKNTDKSGFMRVSVKGSESWQKIAKLLDMDIEQLKKLNTAYKGDCLPIKKKLYTINIPDEKIYAYYLRYELDKQSNLLTMEYMLPYYVKLGDTLDKIAKEYETDSSSIMQANHMIDPYLEVGRLLILPVSKKKFETKQ